METKPNLIYTDQFVLLFSEEEINIGDYYFFEGKIAQRFRKNPLAEYPKTHYKKIIAACPKLSDLLLLPPIGEEEEVNNVLHSFGLTGEENIDIPNKPFPVKKIADACYNRAKKDKGFSLEDMRQFLHEGLLLYQKQPSFKAWTEIYDSFETTFLASLSSRPTSFEIEMEEIKCNCTKYSIANKNCPKCFGKGIVESKSTTIQTPDGKTQLVGKYIYQ